jgi:hypothetical protein
MKTFFEEYKWWLIIVFVTPLVVSYAWFTCDGFIPIGDINKSYWLTFWGGFLAFYGTFFLGLVTIWQNKQFSEQNKQLLNIEVSRQSCNVVLRNKNTNKDHDLSETPITLSNDDGNYVDDKYAMRLVIAHHGDAMLTKIKITFPDNKIFSSHTVLAKGETKYVEIKIPNGLDYKEKAKILFISCNNVVTYGDFKVTLIDMNRAKIGYYHFYGLQENKIKRSVH